MTSAGQQALNWTVELRTDLVRELEDSIEIAPIIDDQGTVRLQEALVARVGGMKIEIRVREHGPPHFHVTYAGEENSFALRDCQPLDGDGLKGRFRNIREWHRRNKTLLIETWNRLRPSDCPAGLYRDE